jgi:hypothetical protein
MSGGSFYYLHQKELCLYGDLVERMAENLDARCSRCGSAYCACAELGMDTSTSTAMKDAAKATREIAALMREIETRQAALADVWHAVEWNESGDTSTKEVASAVAKWAAKNQELPR